MELLQIAVENERTGKGRTFQASLVGYLTCGLLYPQGSDNVRPVMVVIAATDAQSRPFVANLQTGRKAATPSSGRSKPALTIELLKSAGYTYSAQRFEGITVTTAYLAQFFTLDPGMVDPAGIEYVLAPPETWCTEHAATLPVEAMVDHVVRVRAADEGLSHKKAVSREILAQLAPLASLSMAYLDRRTRAPLPQDPRFHLQLFAAMLDESMAFFPSDTPNGRRNTESLPWEPASGSFFYAHQPENMSVGPCLAVKTSHDRFGEVLGKQIRRYFKHVKP